MNDYAPWLTLALLGAYHGLNPGMGWLFAVALGLQERSRSAVLRSFGPIAAGHAASVAAVVALVGALQFVIAPGVLRAIGAGALLLFGLYKLLAPLAHPRWVGMRVNARDLATWSFLMATAHGAGLMLVPVLVPLCLAAMPGGQLTAGGSLAVALAAVGVHTLAMLAATGVVAVLVYEWVGLAVLRHAWVNLDWLWSVALVGAGLLLLVL